MIDETFVFITFEDGYVKEIRTDCSFCFVQNCLAELCISLATTIEKHGSIKSIEHKQEQLVQTYQVYF